MTSREPPSAATRRFCAAVNERGRREHEDSWKDVTARQLERWRQRGLLPQPSRPGKGRGAGRSVEYPPDHLPRALEVAVLARGLPSLHFVAVVLFVRGRPLSEETVRASYTGVLAHFRCLSRRAADRGATKQAETPPQPTAADRADMAEPVVRDRLMRDARSQHLRERIAEAGLGVQATFSGMARGLTGLTLIGRLTRADRDALVAALGLGHLDTTLPPAPHGADIEDLTWDTLTTAIDDASLSDLTHAKDTAAQLHRLTQATESLPPDFASAVAITNSTESEVARALDVLSALYLNRQLGPLLGELLAQLAAHASASR